MPCCFCIILLVYICGDYSSFISPSQANMCLCFTVLYHRKSWSRLLKLKDSALRYTSSLNSFSLFFCFKYVRKASSTIKVLQIEIENYYLQETLTGFKWLANKAIDLMKENKTVLFAFEEAIGKSFVFCVFHYTCATET